MRAIDLYSGVGGWSLGLALAGIEVVASYERFEPANETNRRNNRHPAYKADIRTMSLDGLPANIDLVVGSPPCTQFSYSNRGGGGDVTDGLKDIARFLTIVRHLQPTFWAMENVPRLAAIFEKELAEGGALEEFADLQPKVQIVNMEDWGLPQRRKRCIVGNINFGLLQSYTEEAVRVSLGDVVRALQRDVIVDPIFGTSLLRASLTDHVAEEPLNEEEVRVNRSAKSCHPIYNAMPFPDPLERSVRTITATCTRVSRESVVIAAPEAPGSFRRLTLRERASLQGFPLGFQFYGASHGQKGTMIGNAVPPLFSFYIGQACQGVATEAVVRPVEVAGRFVPPEQAAKDTKVETAGRRYPRDRTFRFSLPGFNFKSGVRFELSNRREKLPGKWNVAFFFGPSKSIQSLKLDGAAEAVILKALPATIQSEVSSQVAELRAFVSSTDVGRMQDVWTRHSPGGTRPFDFLDGLGRSGVQMLTVLSSLSPEEATDVVGRIVFAEYGEKSTKLPGLSKLQRHAHSIIAGVLLGSVVNEMIAPNDQPLPKGQKRLATG